jgi:uncharacterized membrane protein YhiD involved in acid resistance
MASITTIVGELRLAFVLSALIGLEREIHQSAGSRSYTLVGFATALIMLVSNYGFGVSAAIWRGAAPAVAAARRYWRYCWMRVVRRPARPN